MRSRLTGWSSVVAGLAVLVPLAMPSPAFACAGDCDGKGTVSIDELLVAVQIALGALPLTDCAAIDENGDGVVSAAELVGGVRRALEGCGDEPAEEVLFSTQAGQLDTYDLTSGEGAVLIPSNRATVNGQACRLDDGSGNFVVADGGGGPAASPGWGIFSPDATLLKKLPLPDRPGGTGSQNPLGCALDAGGRLFTTAIGAPGADDGLLVVYFPPFYDESCVLADSLRMPGTIAVDDTGSVYVPEATPPGRVLRFAPPFPDDPAGCQIVAVSPTTFIEYVDAVAPFGVAEAASGHWYVSLVAGLGDAGPTIREHDASGLFLRDLFAPGTGGNPVGLAVDSTGAIYYADLGVDEDLVPVPGAGTIRRVVFDATGEPTAVQIFASGLTAPDGVAIFPARPLEWPMLGGSLRRTYFNPFENRITPENVTTLVPKWRYLTDGMISASPVVATIDLPGEGPARLVFAVSWDRHVYALRADNGRRVWSYELKEQTGASYPFAGSPTLARLAGQPLLYVPGGMTMYCLDAATGREIWQFDAGTGCTTCDSRTERNEIESSPAVIDGLVIFGMDVNDNVPGKGGLYGVRADDGRLAWYFDLQTSSTCRPRPEDDVRNFDGFHSAAELGLPEDFFVTRPGCDFDRSGTGCGNVWSSPAVDARRRLLYTVSANCDTDEDPETPKPPPPAPPYDGAIFAVTLDGNPAWVWRPREVDPDDLDFGAVPNLFETEIDGALREVVGVGGKDGTYYVLDRDGVNELTGEIEPYWQRNVVDGGSQGGLIGAATVADGAIYFNTAPGESVFEPQKPTAHAIRATDGGIVWQNPDLFPSFGPNSAIPGLVFTGGTPGNAVNVLSMADGRLLKQLAAGPIVSGVASATVVVDGMVFTGGGVGALNSGSQAAQQANWDTPLSAFCLAGTPGCVENPCDDGDICTYDYRVPGKCMTEPAADGIDCPSASSPTGTCQAGVCVPR